MPKALPATLLRSGALSIIGGVSAAVAGIAGGLWLIADGFSGSGTANWPIWIAQFVFFFFLGLSVFGVGMAGKGLIELGEALVLRVRGKQ